MNAYLSQSYQSFYEVMFVFFIYGFAGWCTEVSYAAVNTGKFVNRGFLNGPICPIYGVGLVVVLGVLNPIRDNFLILYAGSFLLTTVIEFLVGFLLEEVFHNKWWDYSDFPFNIKGYICLKFSIIWGFACVFVVDIFHPVMMKLIRILPPVVGIVILCVFTVTILSDTIITVLNVNQFNKRVRLLNEMGQQLHKISDEIGVNIYDLAIKASETSESVKDDLGEVMADRREEIQDLTNRYKTLLNERHRSHSRLLKAFPGMKSNLSMETINVLKDKAGILRQGIDKWQTQIKELKTRKK